MANSIKTLRLGQPASYCIQVQGVLDSSWSDYFCGLTITQMQCVEQGSITVLSGQIVDQLMLLGVLQRLCNLGLSIRSVEWLMEEVVSS
ncbi:MAG: hypothetical protein H6668_20030 [Ardenticatenaceae bacterium]|nr:hypothetical protein [Ardenticatenaceae bacterium]